MGKCNVCGKSTGFFSFKNKCDECKLAEQKAGISSDEITKILNKPFSDITMDDRRKLCKSDIKMRISKDVASKIIQLSPIDKIPQKTSQITAIGNIEPICPYCNFKLHKMPQKKTKCPNCNNFIRSRKRPLDDKKVLIKEDQLNDLLSQWFTKYEQSLPRLPVGVHRISQDAIQSCLESGLDKEIFPTKIWVIPPEGCPIEDHKLLDGQTVDADMDFEIPSGEWKGYHAPAPQQFGEPALDYNCRCWLVADWRQLSKEEMNDRKNRKTNNF